MPDPFVTPEEPSAAEAIAAIGEELGMFDDWMDRYQFIIELGRKLPPFPEAWRNDAHRVPGCQSKVWMEAVLRDGVLYLGGHVGRGDRLRPDRVAAAGLFRARTPRRSSPPTRCS